MWKNTNSVSVITSEKHMGNLTMANEIFHVQVSIYELIMLEWFLTNCFYKAEMTLEAITL